MIEIKNIKKSYGKTEALCGVYMKAEKGKIHGIVGSAGAGKTTLIKIMAGLIMPDFGSFEIDGENMSENPKKIGKKTGYVPDFSGVYEKLKVIEYMEFFMAAYGLSGNKAKERCNKLMEAAGLKDNEEVFLEELSKKDKKKLSVIRSFIHNPEIILLDEPFEQKSFSITELGVLLKKLGINEKTVIISMEHFEEAAGICSDVTLMKNGKVFMSGTVESIEAHLHTVNPIIMRVKGNSKKAVEVLKADEDVINLTISDENEFHISYSGDEDKEAALLGRIIYAGASVSYFARKGNDFANVTERI